MRLTPELKAEIDSMSLLSMLRRSRFSPTGDPLFQGQSGTYFLKVQARKRDADPAGWTAASQQLGWD